MFRSNHPKIREVEVEVVPAVAAEIAIASPAEESPPEPQRREPKPQPRKRRSPRTTHATRSTPTAAPVRRRKRQRQEAGPASERLARGEAVDVGEAANVAEPFETTQPSEELQPLKEVTEAEADVRAQPATTTGRKSDRVAEVKDQPVEEELTATEEICAIVFWRGYRRATFYARVFSEDGEPLALAQSPAFRARGNGSLEQTDEAMAAYQALREQLEQTGWKHSDHGNAWFDDVFSRPL